VVEPKVFRLFLPEEGLKGKQRTEAREGMESTESGERAEDREKVGFPAAPFAKEARGIFAGELKSILARARSGQIVPVPVPAPAPGTSTKLP
jgi:hypothetical protein